MKTLSIINKHLKNLKEQNSVAPEESQQALDAAEASQEEVSAIGDTGGEYHLLDLAVQCFLYGMMPGKPTTAEETMVLEAKKKFFETEPNKVAEVLKNILKLGKSDQPVANLLTKDQ